jgi:hypothetical protein
MMMMIIMMIIMMIVMMIMMMIMMMIIMMIKIITALIIVIRMMRYTYMNAMNQMMVVTLSPHERHHQIYADDDLKQTHHILSHKILIHASFPLYYSIGNYFLMKMLTNHTQVLEYE